MSSETWQRLLGRPRGEGSSPASESTTKSAGGVESATVEIRVLEAEVKRLRAEREAREAAERDLLQELQRRCDRIIQLEVKVDEQKGAMEKLAKEREEQASYETELMTLLRDTQTPPPPVGQVPKPSASALPPAAQGTSMSSTAAASSASEAALRTRVVELEAERARLVDQRTRQQEEVTSLRVQVKQLKQVIHGLGSTEEEAASRLPAAKALGLSPETLTLLDKCPWSEALVGEVQVEEEAFEWQSWSIFHNWSGAPQHVRTALQGVISMDSEPLLSQVGGESMPLTDGAGSEWVRLEDVSLPGEGWEWIGGWRLDLNNGTSDAEGWCYASVAEDLIAGKGGDQSVVATGKRRVRRRRWVRLRLLVRVEGLSEMATRFLAFHARVASMELLTRKLSEQVLRAQGTINDREMQASRALGLEKHVRSLQQKLAQSEKRAAGLQRELAIMQNEERILKACQVPARASGKKGGPEGPSSSSPPPPPASLPLLSSNGLAKLFGATVIKEASAEAAEAAASDKAAGESGSLPLFSDGGSSAFSRWFQRDSGSSVPASDPSSVTRPGKSEDAEGEGKRMGFAQGIRWFGVQQQQSEEGQKTISDDDEDEPGNFSIDDVAGLVREFGDLDEEEAEIADGPSKSAGPDCEEEEEEELLRGLTPEGAKLVKDLQSLSPPRDDAQQVTDQQPQYTGE